MKTKTEHLISELTKELKPVEVVSFRFSDLLKVVVVGFFCIFAAIAILGLRIDLAERVLTAKFVFDTAMLLALGLLSIIASFSLSVPSLKHKSAYRTPVLAFGLILVATGYSFFATSNPFLYLGHGFSCVSEMVSISILPAAILFFSIRRAAVLRRDAVGVLVLMSGIAFGLLGVQFTCSDSTPLHTLIWHILPTVAVMALGVWVSRKILVKI